MATIDVTARSRHRALSAASIDAIGIGETRPFDTSGAGITAAATVLDIEYVSSAGASLSAILSKLVADAAEVLDYDREATRTLLRRAATLLQSSAARSGLTARAPAQAAFAPWQAKRIASHIDNNFDRPLRVSELAKLTRLSNSYFSRAFKGTFGQTPHAFIICRRVERARQEMLDGREPLAQIAVSCGFADQAHLARLFRRETGLAPSAWRRANRPAVDRLHRDASTRSIEPPKRPALRVS
jgi:AraC-like DNA-binding protein